MKTHYYTSNNQILCKQKHNNLISAVARFSYHIGDKKNCKKCEKLLNDYRKNCKSRCSSIEKLGYVTDCQWRDNNFCYCVDDCAFKEKL